MLDKENIDELINNIRNNEVIARKLFDIENSILSIHNFAEFFEHMLKLIEDKFSIPHVWLSITKNNDVDRILQKTKTSDYVKARLNLIDQQTFDVITRGSVTPVLANNAMFYYHQLLPEKCDWALGSIAIAPLIYEDKVIGSLNQGDSSTERFTPDLDTFFLTQLATKVSICLSNVAAQEKLSILASRDPLTYLFNRRELSILMEKEFARQKRGGSPFSIIFIDCDDFKQVNDQYGHGCGDEYLIHVSQHMNHVIRQEDNAFRFAGDEFVILLPGQNARDAEMVAHRLRASLQSQCFIHESAQIEAKISFGIACTASNYIESPEDLLKIADQNLYQDKSNKHSRGKTQSKASIR